MQRCTAASKAVYIDTTSFAFIYFMMCCRFKVGGDRLFGFYRDCVVFLSRSTAKSGWEIRCFIHMDTFSQCFWLKQIRWGGSIILVTNSVQYYTHLYRAYCIIHSHTHLNKHVVGCGYMYIESVVARGENIWIWGLLYRCYCGNLCSYGVYIIVKTRLSPIPTHKEHILWMKI